MHALNTLVTHPNSTRCESATGQKSFPLFSTKPVGLRHIASNPVPRSGAFPEFPIRAHLPPRSKTYRAARNGGFSSQRDSNKRSHQAHASSASRDVLRAHMPGKTPKKALTALRRRDRLCDCVWFIWRCFLFFKKNATCPSRPLASGAAARRLARSLPPSLWLGCLVESLEARARVSALAARRNSSLWRQSGRGKARVLPRAAVDFFPPPPPLGRCRLSAWASPLPSSVAGWRRARTPGGWKQQRRGGEARKYKHGRGKKQTNPGIPSLGKRRLSFTLSGGDPERKVSPPSAAGPSVDGALSLLVSGALKAGGQGPSAPRLRGRSPGASKQPLRAWLSTTAA